jgi:short-subunit dehydrogenase
MFIRQFTEGLHAELKDTEVSVQAVCPGFFRAQLWESSRQDKKTKYPGILSHREREEVVEQLMQDLGRGKIISTPGIRRGFLSRSPEDYLEKTDLVMNKIS